MKINQIVITILLLTSLFAFTERERTIAEKLIGTWVYDKYEEEAKVFNKETNFQKDNSGIQFLEDGKLLKRQNVGWCGTPPITYGNDEGTWTMSNANDSIVTIKYEYWGGKIEAEWKIIQVDKEQLKVKRIAERATKRRN